jgi:hypothetical protein
MRASSVLAVLTVLQSFGCRRPLPPGVSEPAPTLVVEAKAPAPRTWTPCPHELGDVPTHLWQSVLVQTPVGVTLVEDGPTRATTRASAVSTCGATVDRMLIVALPNDPARSLDAYLADFLAGLEREGYGGATRGATKDAFRFLWTDFVFQTTSGPAPAQALVKIIREDESVFVLFYQTHPEQWVALKETFRQSALSLFVHPEE